MPGHVASNGGVRGQRTALPSADNRYGKYTPGGRKLRLTPALLRGSANDDVCLRGLKHVDRQTRRGHGTRWRRRRGGPTGNRESRACRCRGRSLACFERGRGERGDGRHIGAVLDERDDRERGGTNCREGVSVRGVVTMRGARRLIAATLFQLGLQRVRDVLANRLEIERVL